MERRARGRQRARAGGGPTLIECKTYRTRAHSEGMRDAGYRTAEEVAQWRARDPLIVLRQRLEADGSMSMTELDAIDEQAQTLAEEAIRFAQNSPWPDPATAADHVYSS